MDSRSHQGGDADGGILIVEDERIVAMDLARTLRGLGYEVAGSVGKAEEALARLAELRPKLVLMDVRLAGDMDGIQAAQAIRRSHDVPVVYLTAHSDDETIKRAASSLAFGYVVKPFRATDLRCSIEIALHKHAADSRLQRQESWIATAIDSVLEGVIATDASGRVKLCNPHAELLTGQRQADVLHKAIEDLLILIDEQNAAPLDNPVRLVLRGATAHCGSGHELVLSRTGASTPVEERSAPIVDLFGKVLGAIVVLRDVSEQRRHHGRTEQLKRDLEQRASECVCELQQANAALDALSHSVAHELHVPLQAIEGHAQMLISPTAPSAADHQARRILLATTQIRSLIDGMLSLVSVGRGKLECSNVDVSTLVHQIAIELLAQYPTERFTLRIQPHMQVNSDPHLLHTILFNLLQNAFKFSSQVEAPQISVDMTNAAGSVIFRVHDNGVGFDPLQATRLFEAFERLPAASELPGIGIGLAIVRRAIERLRGQIWANAEPNRGATFSFTLGVLNS